MQSALSTESIVLHTNLNGRSQHRIDCLKTTWRSHPSHSNSTRKQDEEETDLAELSWKRPYLPETRALFIKHDQINSRLIVDVFADENKQTRGRTKNYDCFICRSSCHRHIQCSITITHPGVIKRSRGYAEFFRVLDRSRRGGPTARAVRKPTIISEVKKEVEVNHINTCILLNETMSETKLYATGNSYINLLYTTSPVTIVRKEYVLSDVRMVENQLFVFGNHEGVLLEI